MAVVVVVVGAGQSVREFVVTLLRATIGFLIALSDFLPQNHVFRTLPLLRRGRQGRLVFFCPPIVLVFAVGDLKLRVLQLSLLLCRGRNLLAMAGLVFRALNARLIELTRRSVSSQNPCWIRTS